MIIGGGAQKHQSGLDANKRKTQTKKPYFFLADLMYSANLSTAIYIDWWSYKLAYQKSNTSKADNVDICSANAYTRCLPFRATYNGDEL